MYVMGIYHIFSNSVLFLDGNDSPYIDPMEDPYIIPFHRKSEDLPYTEPCPNSHTDSGIVETCT